MNNFLLLYTEISRRTKSVQKITNKAKFEENVNSIRAAPESLKYGLSI